MKTHLLLEKGGNPSAMAAILLGCALLLLFIVWTGHAQPGEGNPVSQVENPPPPDTNCYTALVSNQCTEGALVLTNLQISPASSVCVGLGMGAYATQFPTNGVSVVTEICTNLDGSAHTNVTTNVIVTVALSFSWAVSGVDAWPNSGSGLYAPFTPLSQGAGAVTFTAPWQHGCDTNQETALAFTNFTVVCPDMRCA
jgi:hypothetical protein